MADLVALSAHYLFCFLQAVEELLESLELEKSSYQMGLSRVSGIPKHAHFMHDAVIFLIQAQAFIHCR